MSIASEAAIRMTDFEEEVAGFLQDERERYRKVETCARKRTELGIFGRWLAERGHRDLGAVREEDVVSFLSRIKGERPRDVGAVARFTTTLRTFFRYLRDVRKFPTDPTEDLRVKRPKRKPRNILTHEEVKSLLEAAAPCPSSRRAPVYLRDRAILEVMYSCGLRRSEVVGLDLGDVDLSARTVFIREGKYAKDRVVPMGRTASKWMGRYLEEGRIQQRPRPEETAVFVTQWGKRIGPIVVEQTVARGRKRAKITRCVTPHSLRATCASHLLWAGAELREIAEFLGHNCLVTTAYYCAPGEWSRGEGGTLTTPSSRD